MAGRKVFTSGEILTASDVNSFLMNQVVAVFADDDARSSAIPSPSEGMVTFREDQDVVEVFDGSTFKAVGSGFTDSETITATNANFPIPTLASPIVKVTVIGGGGGGGRQNSSGGAGGSSSFNAGGAGTIAASGGAGGGGGAGGVSGNTGFRAANYGGGFHDTGFDARPDGNSGVIVVGYLNLTGVSTANVTVGAGGSSPSSAGNGGRGEVILEFVAG